MKCRTTGPEPAEYRIVQAAFRCAVLFLFTLSTAFAQQLGPAVGSGTAGVPRSTVEPVGGPSVGRPNTTSQDDALRTLDGTPVSRYVAGGVIRGVPVPGPGGTVYVTAEDRYLHAAGPDGTPKWRYDIGGRTSDLIGTGPDGTIYVGTDRGVIHAVNPAGNGIWSYRADGSPVTGVAFDAGGSLYFGTSDEVLNCVSHTGKLRWRYYAPGGITAGPVIDSGGVIYAASARGVLYALTPWGDTLWSVRLQTAPGLLAAGFSVRAAPEHGTAFRLQDEERRVFVADPAELVVFDGAGRMLASTPFESPPVRLFTDSEGGAVCMLASGTVLSFTPDGAVRSRTETGVQVRSSVYAVRAEDGTLFVSPGGGTILRIAPGRTELSEAVIPLYKETGKADFAGLSLSPDGILSAGWDNWVLTSFHTGSRASVPVFYAYEPPETAAGAVSSRVRTGEDGAETGQPERAPGADYAYLMEFARSGRPELKEIALSDIEARIERRELRDSGGYVRTVLRYLSDEALFRTTFRGRNVTNNHTALRIRAIGLLAETAGITDVSYFLMLLRYEYDSLVRTALVRALGTVASDPDGEACRRLAELLPAAGRTADDRLADSIVWSLGRIHEYHGTAPSQGFFEALQLITNGNFSRPVREKALILQRRARDN